MTDRSVGRMMLAAGGLAFLLGLAAILSAWGFQLIGGYIPCKLCLEERIAYYAGLPVLAVALLLEGNGKLRPVSRGLFALGGLVFVGGCALAVYHAGAEWAFWPGPADCGGGAKTTSDVNNLLAQIQATHIVSCTEASFRFLGLSFAGWNAVVSLIVAGLAFIAALTHAGSRPARLDAEFAKGGALNS